MVSMCVMLSNNIIHGLCVFIVALFSLSNISQTTGTFQHVDNVCCGSLGKILWWHLIELHTAGRCAENPFSSKKKKVVDAQSCFHIIYSR